MYQARTVYIGQKNKNNYCTNAINNQKYNFFTFIPLVLYNQFKFFLNLYFLIVALTQFINQVKIGYLYTYWGPLGFVLTITMFREAIDDFRRYRRDQEVNSTVYTKLTPPLGKSSHVTSANIKVGDLILIEKNQRVPADVVLLRTTETNGSCFIRTDQLDGETDWKPRMAVPYCQSLTTDVDLFNKLAQSAAASGPAESEMSIFAEKPQKDIHIFIGSFTMYSGGVVKRTEPLSIENTLWASSVVASGTALGLVIYTGRETRSVMNTSQPRSKVGLTDLEVNQITKVLFVSVITLSLLLMVLKGFTGPWYRYLVRFILLFSYIIPISLRVNLDLAKMAYAYMIMRDKEMPGNVCRNTTIPEELGRINYLFSDKTGTLTKNEMVFKKLYLGHSSTSFGPESDPEVAHLLITADKMINDSLLFTDLASCDPIVSSSSTTSATHQIPLNRKTKSLVIDLYETVKALTICNNVTPVNAPIILTGQGGSTGDPFLKSSIGIKSPFSTKHNPFPTPKLFQSSASKAQTGTSAAAATTTTKDRGHTKIKVLAKVPTEAKVVGPVQKIVTSTSSDLTSPSKASSTNRDSLTESVLSDSTCGSASQLIASVPSSGSTNDCFDSSNAPAALAYQASSPDEVALVTWTGKVGMRLEYRDMTKLKIVTPIGRLETYTVLHLIPFTSEKKRMGIIVKEESTGTITFYVKGADTAISAMVAGTKGGGTDGVSSSLASRTPYGSSNRSFSASSVSGSLGDSGSSGSSSDDSDGKVSSSYSPQQNETLGSVSNVTKLQQRRRKGGGNKNNNRFDSIDLNDGLYYQRLKGTVSTTTTTTTNNIGKAAHENPEGSIPGGQSSNLAGILTHPTTAGHCDWLEEESGNLAREGLRTLVIGKRVLSAVEYSRFARRLKRAELSFVSSGAGGRPADRTLAIARAHALLEQKVHVLAVTGVEDKLQDGVPHSLEMLRNAGIKIWMLTGDKLETAICIAKSSHLVQRHQTIFVFKEIADRTQAYEELSAYRSMKEFVPVIISGPSLELCLQHYEPEFMELACLAQSVIVCRASPTQKASLVRKVPRYATSLINSNNNDNVSSRTSPSTPASLGRSLAGRKKIGNRRFMASFGGTEKCRTCAIGDGGNDVNMIQASHLGVGIVGREGKQASLAADFSLTQFSHLSKLPLSYRPIDARLILVHGRNSYKRTAALSQFIIHRGLIISIMQAVFSAIFFFASIALYQGYLMIGYSTIYTMFPVFSLVLDKDVTPKTALMYPELYKDLVKGRALSYKTFFTWVLISIYQGSVMMFGALLLFDDEFVHVVSITFTALILTELFMVAITIRTWHWLIVSAEMFSLAVYLFSLMFLRNYFDTEFIKSSSFIWKVLVVTLISCLPLFLFKYLARKLSPPIYAKLN